jgi:hypothetical protein
VGQTVLCSSSHDPWREGGWGGAKRIVEGVRTAQVRNTLQHPAPGTRTWLGKPWWEGDPAGAQLNERVLHRLRSPSLPPPPPPPPPHPSARLRSPRGCQCRETCPATAAIPGPRRHHGVPGAATRHPASGKLAPLKFHSPCNR